MLSYSTGGLPSSAKVAYWNRALGDVFTPLETRPAGGEFDAELQCAKFGRLRLVKTASRAATVRRSKSQTSRTDEPRYFLRVLLRGKLLIRQDRHEAFLEAGDLVLNNSALPYSLTYDDDCRTLVLVVTEKEMRRRFPTPEEMIGVKLSGQAGLPRTTALMLESIWEQAEEGFPPDVGSRLADNLLDMFATASMVMKGAAVTGPTVVSARRVQIRRYIEANLRNPELGVRAVAAAFGISSRYLQILFSAESETVSSYILRRRLEECGKELADALWRRRTITEVAFGWGFNNATHFARVFRNQYGTSPRAYRASHAVDDDTAAWLKTLRKQS